MRGEEWRLGKDLVISDNLLDPITFEDLITAVHCDCREINRKTALNELDRILAMREQDMRYLLARNLDGIMKMAREGRGDK